MKSAIYLDNGTTQVVLTPENEWEKNALRMINKGNRVQTWFEGFYECRGGWYRQAEYDYQKTSLIFRIDEAVETPIEVPHL